MMTVSDIPPAKASLQERGAQRSRKSVASKVSWWHTGQGDRLALDATIAIGILLFGLLFLANLNLYQKSSAVLTLSSAVIMLALAPILQWMFDSRRCRLPIFQIHCTFYALSFGIVGFFPDLSTLTTTVEETFMQQAQWASLLSLVCLLIGFYGAGWIFPKLRPQPSFIVLSSSHQERITMVLISILYACSFMTQFLQLSFLRQILLISSQFTFLIITANWISGRLSRTGKMVYVLFLLPLNLLAGLASGQIAGFIMTAISIMILSTTHKRRVPWSSILVVAAVYVILQPVKAQFRYEFWQGRSKAGMLERLDTFGRIGLAEIKEKSTISGSNSMQNALEISIQRLNHLHVTGAVIRDTPALVPYRYGSTYLPLLTKWIPRFVWAGKPEERLGNEWARAYGYLGESDFTTAFNLRWLPEMFINFGWLGVVCINLLLGAGFSIFHQLYLDRPFGLSGVAFGLALGTNLIFVESNLSLTIGDFLIGFISLWAISFVLRHLIQEEPAHMSA